MCLFVFSAKPKFSLVAIGMTSHVWLHSSVSSACANLYLIQQFVLTSGSAIATTGLG